MIKGMMRFNSLTFRFRTLRATLGVLLALHLGLAPTGMAHAAAMRESAATEQIVASVEAAVPPCHQAAAADADNSPSSPVPEKSHLPCCKVSQCHCMSACYVDAIVMAPTGVFVSYSMAAQLDTPAAVTERPVRRFRPPIV